MKKIMSLALSLMLVIGSITCLFITPVAALGDEVELNLTASSSSMRFELAPDVTFSNSTRPVYYVDLGAFGDSGSLYDTVTLKRSTSYSITYSYRNYANNAYFRPHKEATMVIPATSSITDLVGDGDWTHYTDGKTNDLSVSEFNNSLNRPDLLWCTQTFEFITNDTDDTYHIILGLRNGPGYIANIRLEETQPTYTMSASADGNGAAFVSAEEAIMGHSVTFTATPYAGSVFEGWYDAAGDLVSVEASYEVIAADNLDLTAKFTGSYVDWYPSLGIHNSDYARTELSSADDYADGPGWKAAKLNNNSLAAVVTLKPGTEYQLQMYLKGDAEVSNAPNEAWVISKKAEFATASGDRYRHWSGAYSPVTEGYTVDDNCITSFPADVSEANTESWRAITFNFVTGEDSEYIIALKFVNGTDSCEQYFSDTTITEVVTGDAPAADAFIAHPGTAIRKASESVNGQALRFKFTVDKDVINNAQTDGYELVEYGAVVASTSALAGYSADPIIDATNYTVHKTVAYEKVFGAADATTNVVFSENDSSVTFSVALYNISEDNYGKEFSIRPYAVFSNGIESYVRYGTTRTACIYAVVYEILSSPVVPVEDLAYVNNTLLPVGSNAKSGYTTWVSENR